MVTPGNRVFCVASLTAQGELRSKAPYRYEELEKVPGAAELIGHLSGVLWRAPEGFETELTAGVRGAGGTTSIAGAGGTGRSAGLNFRWRSSAPTAGVATLRCCGDLTSLSLLLTGISPEADAIILQTLQRHLLHELRDTGFEPAFALTDLAERPLVTTIDFCPPAASAEQMTAALADRCFAASYFRYHGLA